MEIKLIQEGRSLPDRDTTVLGCYQSPTFVEPPVGTDEPDFKLRSLLDEGSFEGELGETCSVTLVSARKMERVVLCGLGRREALTLEGLRKAVHAAIRESKHIKARKLLFNLIGYSSEVANSDIARLIPEIALLSMYKFDRYKTEKKPESLETIDLYCGEEPSAEVVSGFREGLILAGATSAARDLVNEPSNILTPEEFSRRIKKGGEESDFSVDVLDEKQIDTLGMKAFLEVARGSDNPPRLIVMRYRGNGAEGAPTIGLVGKGLTYDSGGLSIKTNDGMVTMKRDMGGAAAVVGAVSAIARLKLKANVVGVIAACENMISGRSFRPGDVIGSMAGKSIYVGSTDAEGRLTLVDAIHYAIEKEGVSKIVDLATLTGAATQALGYAADVVVSNNDELYSILERASVLSGEKKWRMPIFDEYRELIKSDIADLTNSAGKPGAITAGMFIGEFVQDRPWVHIDIAPSAWVDENKDYRSKGGTGSGVRSLYYLVKELSLEGV